MENAPKLRFEGFDGEWERKHLGEMSLAFEYGLNAAAKEFDGRSKYIRITDIDDESHEFTKKNITSPDIDMRIADPYKLQEGDVLFARTGASVGKSYLYKKTDGEVYFAGFLIRARIKKEYNPQFIFQNTLTKEYEKYIAITSQRSGQPGVNAQEYAQFELSVPSKIEQDFIGKFFATIDHLLTLHQRKYDALLKAKQFYLQNLFPKKGEKVPAIRFAGFEGDWKKTEFSKLATTRRGLTYKPSSICKNGIRVLRSSNISGNNFVFSLDDIFVNPDDVNIPLANNGDILITSANGSSKLVGKHAIITGLPSKTAAHGGFMLLATAKNPAFVNAYMDTSWYSEFIALHIAGGNGAIGNLNKKDLDNQTVFLPSNEEQERIGSFFSTFDSLLTLQSRKLETLKKMKQFMLQNLFV